MIQYPKRLIEVDLPIKRISAHARLEKSIWHGHISTLHIWWTRRSLAARQHRSGSPFVKVEHYRLKQDAVKHPPELKEYPTPYRIGGDE